MRKIASMCAMLMLCGTLTFAQNRTITGQVKDEKGSPIPFATISETRTNRAVTADANGNFTISVGENARLSITATGYQAQEVASNNASSIMLVRGEKQLDEVVVTAQGIRRKAKELGYSVGRVSNDELTNGRSPQIAQGLAGKVSGLAVFNVNQSVDPSVKITLRGYRSLTGNNDALIVIDGLQQPPGSSTMLNLLNPNDIESITILKGGQAATLYGSDGVNGALVITTKKGSAGKVRISYSNSTNIEKLNQLAQFQDKFGSGSHYATSYGAAGYKTDYLARMKDNWRSYENQQFGDQYDGSMRPAGRTLEDGSVLMLPYSAIKGERERIWNTGFTTNNQVSVSGGSNQTTFFLSGEHNITHGIVPSDKSNRTGIRFAASTEAGRLRAGFNANYVQANYDRTTFDFYNETINQAAHIPLSDFRDWRNNKFASPNAYYNDYFTNPFFRLDNDRTKYGDNNINGNVELNFKVAPWLNLYNRLGAMSNNRQRTSTVAQYIHSDWAKSKAKVPAPFDQGDGSGITRALTDLQGSVLDQTTVETVLSNDFQAQMNHDFGVFSARGLVGFSSYERKNRVVSVSSNSIVIPEVYNVGNRRGELGGSEDNVQYRKFGYYADGTLGWNEKIFLHGTARYDGTSKFYKPERDRGMYQYAYYGADLSAVMTELVPSIKGDILSYAKLRAGYSKNGNDNLGTGVNYGLDAVFTNAPGFPYGNTVGYTVDDVLPDANLKPEFVKSWEVGGEFQFLNNRISLDLTHYNQKSEGQVLTVKIPNTTGYPNLRINVGDTKNWGYEADLRGQIIHGKNFNWDMSVRYSYNENKVLKLYQGVPEFSYGAFTYAAPYVILGESFPALKAISYVRDDAGHVIVNSSTGYPLTTGPLKNFGSTIPKHILGWGTKLNFKEFTLNTNFEYRGGNVIYSDLGRQMTFTGSGKWTEDRAPHIFPNSAYYDAAGKSVVNTTVMTREAEYALWVDSYRLIAENFVAPGWFIKLRDINLSYDVPSSLITKTRIFSGATVSLYGRNLITIVDEKNQFTDPEFSFTNNNGVGVSTTGQTPPVRQYGINLNINFK
ncbi:SusC/RagA family TonB-linked outer membrane protein [Flavisolibacter tropicus]|uniref:TonB-dependent receptor n=1 Tax=Flavisolibacter tropicus TaxID=1492898 RepID=A0A172TYZ3_9BACT|nr:SusC/RagA family TonB-linked outer membrane protein [Flavisolibacter tropicus]ANE52270.1 TonB-dependent receptor [Flavisolibacter tropicus]